jgi:hypothetical protein
MAQGTPALSTAAAGHRGRSVNLYSDGPTVASDVCTCRQRRLLNARLLDSLCAYRRLLLLRLFEIHAAMTAPAAVISEGSNFSMNSVIMQKRAVSTETPVCFEIPALRRS